MDKKKRWLANIVIITTMGIYSWSFLTIESHWPFVAFAMYADIPNYKERLKYELQGSFPDGEILKIDTQKVPALSFYFSEVYRYILAIRTKDPTRYQHILEKIKSEINAQLPPQRQLHKVWIHVTTFHLDKPSSIPQVIHEERME